MPLQEYAQRGKLVEKLKHLQHHHLFACDNQIMMTNSASLEMILFSSFKEEAWHALYDAIKTKFFYFEKLVDHHDHLSIVLTIPL